MSHLLQDILDYSELLAERMVLKREVFAPERLRKASKLHAERTANGRLDRFTVRLHADLPGHLLGDPHRIEQVIRHALHFIIDQVGTKTLTLEIDWRDGRLALRFCVGPSATHGPGWLSRAFLGQDRRSDNHRGQGPNDRPEFATDSIGPAIARGLVARMGGHIELEEAHSGPSGGEETAIVVTIPIEVQARLTRLARIEARSATTRAVIGALVRKAGWTLWHGSEEEAAVRLILIELTQKDEAALAGRLRVQHPMARVIAIGAPLHPELFDAVCRTVNGTEILAELENDGHSYTKVAS